MQVLAWPLIGLLMAALFLLFEHRARTGDLLLGSAMAATLGGVFGYLLAFAFTAGAATLPFGLIGASTMAWVALFAVESKANRTALR
jgi:hypothetical protein